MGTAGPAAGARGRRAADGLRAAEAGQGVRGASLLIITTTITIIMIIIDTSIIMTTLLINRLTPSLARVGVGPAQPNQARPSIRYVPYIIIIIISIIIRLMH